MTTVGIAASLDRVPLPRSPTASVIATATYTRAVGCAQFKTTATNDASMRAHTVACLHTMWLSTLRSKPKHHKHLLPLLIGDRCILLDLLVSHVAHL